MIAALKNKKFNLQLQLKEIGIPPYVTDTYDESTLELMTRQIKINPWQFYNKDTGFSIKLCEKISELYKCNDEIEKCKAYLQWSIDKVAEQGHCYAKEWQIDNIIKNQYFSDYNKQKAINFLQKENLLYVSDKNNYFLLKYFNAEVKFSKLLKNQAKRNGYSTGFRKQYSYLYEDLNETQQSVVDAVEYNSLIVLTGLPGTGKTTTIRAIVDSYGYTNVILLAPTGKAAARMSELCNAEASTLHSFFFNPNGFIRTVEDKIVIIDELSMCDAEVAGWIAEGISDSCVLILVGDPDQLPSVGPGQVLKDVLDSNIGSRYHLNKIMRQKPGSIIKSAHSIHSGNNVIFGSDNEVVPFYPNKWDLETISSKIANHPEWRNAQYLSVLREKGSQIINKVAQNIINPNNVDGFRVGDKVIHTKNNKDLGVYNGEMGTVIKTLDRKITVEFRDKIIDYTTQWLWQLDLAYCITVHKSQGSEFDRIVFFVNQSQITTRNLIYTAITRAKNKVLIVAPSEQILLDAIKNKQKPRQTSLAWLLKKE